MICLKLCVTSSQLLNFFVLSVLMKVDHLWRWRFGYLWGALDG
jgi:hypothetical protein